MTPVQSAPSAERPWLVGDIGGTNARFGLVREAGARPVHVGKVPSALHDGLASAARAYLAGLPERVRPSAACVAVAGPVLGDRIKLTNVGWDFSVEQDRTGLGLDRLEVVNDFAALAQSLPALGEEDLLPLGGGSVDPAHPMAVLGPGTGLGVAGLVPLPSGGWLPLPGEGGHVDAPAVEDLEAEVVRVITAERGRVSAEALLSGPGLPRLHRALGEILGTRAPDLTPGEITAAGTDPDGSDSLARETLEVFGALLGGFAGNVALTLGATGGVFLGGGVLPRIPGVLRDGRFRMRFEAKGRMTDYLKNIATVLITADNPALLGTAARLDQQLERA
ncbi:glucokinase [Nocardiopsis composta]|uniref:Glucokinase n=1 Tax=Nocardiopsis composta TaxID=157465 RepID=A0A7W8QIJ4_9ACTN|nr:glucokinase [Nocardiopsis composta]